MAGDRLRSKENTSSGYTQTGGNAGYVVVGPPASQLDRQQLDNLEGPDRRHQLRITGNSSRPATRRGRRGRSTCTRANNAAAPGRNNRRAATVVQLRQLAAARLRAGDGPEPATPGHGATAVYVVVVTKRRQLDRQQLDNFPEGPDQGTKFTQSPANSFSADDTALRRRNEQLSQGQQ